MLSLHSKTVKRENDKSDRHFEGVLSLIVLYKWQLHVLKYLALPVCLFCVMLIDTHRYNTYITGDLFKDHSKREVGIIHIPNVISLSLSADRLMF